MTIKLGDRVRDKVTGFEGIAIGRSTWLYGCERIGIEPTTLDDGGLPIEPVFFDEQRILLVEAALVPKVPKRVGETEIAPTLYLDERGNRREVGPNEHLEGDVIKKGGPRRDDRGGTPSAMRGTRGAGYRRDL